MWMERGKLCGAVLTHVAIFQLFVAHQTDWAAADAAFFFLK
jgi:hypothetical protein